MLRLAWNKKRIIAGRLLCTSCLLESALHDSPIPGSHLALTSWLHAGMLHWVQGALQTSLLAQALLMRILSSMNDVCAMLSLQQQSKGDSKAHSATARCHLHDTAADRSCMLYALYNLVLYMSRALV